eukprot:scaffold219172_cov24-Tisochrysis_lutea.AAC.3
MDDLQKRPCRGSSCILIKETPTEISQLWVRKSRGGAASLWRRPHSLQPPPPRTPALHAYEKRCFRALLES